MWTASWWQRKTTNMLSRNISYTLGIKMRPWILTLEGNFKKCYKMPLTEISQGRRPSTVMTSFMWDAGGGKFIKTEGKRNGARQQRGVTEWAQSSNVPPTPLNEYRYFICLQAQCVHHEQAVPTEDKHSVRVHGLDRWLRVVNQSPAPTVSLLQRSSEAR